MLLKLLIHFTLFECFIFSLIPVPILIYENAKANIKDKSWALRVERQAKRNKKIIVLKNEEKGNLFVYEIILAAGYNIGTPNSVDCDKEEYKEICAQGNERRPPSCKDWFDEKVPGFSLVGMNDEGRKICKTGDIITNGKHIGVVSNTKNGYSINTGEDEVIENDFGFKQDELFENFKIFRYNETESRKTSSGKFLTASIAFLFLIMII